jgi:hypothetical protein
MSEQHPARTARASSFVCKALASDAAIGGVLGALADAGFDASPLEADDATGFR